MRIQIWFLVLASTVGCAIDSGDSGDSGEVASAITVTRSGVEQNCDALLRANGGHGCGVENGRQVCVVTTAVRPARVLQIGDPVPSSTTLRLCSAGTCNPVPPVASPYGFHCPTISSCLPIAVGCANGGRMTCEPVANPFGGESGLSCSCDLDD
jgi:hypothetical protein